MASRVVERRAYRAGVGRTVTLVLCDGRGTVLGALEPFAVATPWWQDASDVIATARAVHGIDVTVVRLLAAELDAPPGGAVTYLAELHGAPPAALAPVVDREPRDHPLRQTWARPGGSAADLAWADRQLARSGRPRRGPAQQVRTWNLSSLWRMPTDRGPVWLKVVPSFFAHEGAVLSRIEVGPPVIATDGPRSLLADVAGDDLYEPVPDQIAAMVRLLVGEQARWVGRIGELLALGVPDWRPEAFVPLAADVVERTAPELPARTVDAARRLVADLSDRFAALATCGIPDSIVHGDFHGGNVRADGDHLVVLDWGDSGVGHPLLDQPATTEHLPADVAAAARRAWVETWQLVVPGSEPQRAAELIAPIAALRQAVVYRRFLDRIEPAERSFHRRDPALWLTRAVR